MAGTAEANRARRDRRCDTLDPNHHRRDRPIRRHPVCAPSLGVEVRAINVRDAAEIERAVAAFASSSNSGMIVTASALAIAHRDLIVTLAARHKLPTIYPHRVFVTGGGLISYGPDFLDQYRRAAGYVDRT